MKKIIFLSALSVLLINALFGIYLQASKQTFALIHEASTLNAVMIEAPKVPQNQELVSVAYANKPVIDTQEKTMIFNQPNLETLFPYLQITGVVSSEYLDLIKKVLFSLPADKLQTLKTLKIINVKDSKRGVGGTNTIIINTYNLSREEFVSVLTHELGHVIDLGGINGNPMSSKSAFNDGPNPIYTNDLSVAYYNYSWEDTYRHQGMVGRNDFVSGYAMSDPFEDFAEAFTFYTLHNRDFQALAVANTQLAKKYAWIRDNIFNGKEPATGKGEMNPNKRVWDITKLGIEI